MHENKKEKKMTVDSFRKIFGVPRVINGVSGRLNWNGSFFPDTEIDKIVSELLSADGTIRLKKVKDEKRKI